MAEYVYQVWCEWDIGLYETFKSNRMARDAAVQALKDQFGDDLEYTYQNLYEQGLINIERKELNG